MILQVAVEVIMALGGVATEVVMVQGEVTKATTARDQVVAEVHVAVTEVNVVQGVLVLG